MDMIEFTPEKLKRLKKARASAVERGDTQFTFEGKEVLVSYAKYMIEYLETQLEGK